MPPATKYDLFCFTWNNYGDDAIKYIHEKLLPDCQWLVYGKEIAPTTETPHLQGAYWLHNPKTQQQQAFKFSRRGGWTHYVTNSSKTPAYWREYCSKEDNDAFEVGVPPTAEQWAAYMKYIGERKRTDMMQFVEDCKTQKPSERKILEEYTHLAAKYPRFIERVVREYHKPETLDKLDNEWWYGPSETGKSRTAREQYPDCFSKSAKTKWWDNYKDHECVLIEEMDPEHGRKIAYEMKIWCDHYPFYAETKGGTMYIRPKKIIVTSNYSIDEIYGYDPKMLAPIKRRFKEVRFGPPSPPAPPRREGPTVDHFWTTEPEKF